MNRWAFWIPPALTAAVAVGFYGPFGYARDFGAMIIGVFFLMPALGLILLVSGLWALIDRRPRWRTGARSLFLAALVPAVLVPVLWRFGDPLRDPARYAVWSVFHARYLSAARQKDGVFLYWDSWGMGGEENDSYLASDPTDTLARPGVADRWATAHRLGCPLVAVRRMDHGVYLLTTSNCPLQGGET